MHLKTLMQRIEQYQKFFGHDRKDKNLYQRRDYINSLVLGAQIELAEMLQEMPWKPWRPVESQCNNISAASEELIDALIFLLDIAYQMGLSSSQIAHLVNRKLNTNLARLKSGHHKTNLEE